LGRYTNGGKDVAKYKDAKALPKSVWVELKGSWHELKYHVLHKTGVDYVFIEHMAFQRPGTPYGDQTGPFKDNLFRWVGAGAARAVVTTNACSGL
jgi:hypothetical protein